MLNFALRTNGSASALAPGVNTAIAEINPRFFLNLIALKDRIDESLRRPRTLAQLSGLFGALALVLAATGLYGIMSYTVARRRNEIGGASRSPGRGSSRRSCIASSRTIPRRWRSLRSRSSRLGSARRAARLDPVAALRED